MPRGLLLLFREAAAEDGLRTRGDGLAGPPQCAVTAEPKSCAMGTAVINGAL